MPVGALSLPISSVLTGQPEVIGHSVLTGAAASVSFQFPVVYRAVLVEWWINTSQDAAIWLRLNNDSGTNYSRQYIGANGATVSGARATGETKIGTVNSTGGTDGASASILVVKTTAAARAQVIQTGGMLAPASIRLELIGGEWNNTADLLSRIDILPSAGNLDANTAITLWGFRL